MNKTIEELVRKAFTNPYSGEKQDLSPIDESDFREALTKAYEAGQANLVEWIRENCKVAEEDTGRDTYKLDGVWVVTEADLQESLKAKTDE